MKVSLANTMLLILCMCIALAWFVDHRVQVRNQKTLENTVVGLRGQLDKSSAGNALIQGYLNFFRIEQGSSFTAQDYKKELNVLKREYSRRFPDWAATQESTD